VTALAVRTRKRVTLTSSRDTCLKRFANLDVSRINIGGNHGILSKCSVFPFRFGREIQGVCALSEKVKKGKRLKAIGGLILTLAFVTACSRTAIPSHAVETRQVLDDLGRSVSVPLKIERAVSLAPSVTEMIFAVGAGDKLVGVTTYCNYPEAAKAIQKIGDTMTPNIESIIALRPQVVFVSTASQLEAFTSTLDEQGIAVFVTDPKDLVGVNRNLSQLGELFGTQERADSLVRELKFRAAKIGEETKGSKPKVFVQISKDPLFTIGKESFLTEVIANAGGDSVTKDVPTAYPKLSKETAYAMNPDVIILSDSEDNRGPNVVFKNSPAVKNGRVYRIDPDIISRPGPRLVDAIEEIASDLHPESER